MPQKRVRTKQSSYSIKPQRLNEMIEEATVDCYNESEQVTGLFTMIEEHLSMPFVTTLLSLKVTVEGIALNDADEIVAICKRGAERQRVPILDLPLPTPRPDGSDWIEAYRRWAKVR